MTSSFVGSRYGPVLWPSLHVPGRVAMETVVEQHRIVGVLAAIATQAQGSLADRLCAAAQQQLACSGVGLSLAVNDELLESVAGTDGARHGEALQAELGEGPSYTSSRYGWPVLVPDVRQDDTWPAFGGAATALGLCSIFAFPLRRGAVRIGALTLYRDVHAAFTDDHHADALIYASLAHDLMIALQAGRPMDQLDQLILDGTAESVEVHQAAGVVSVQLGIDVGTALSTGPPHHHCRAHPRARHPRGEGTCPGPVSATRIEPSHDLCVLPTASRPHRKGGEGSDGGPGAVEGVPAPL